MAPLIIMPKRKKAIQERKGLVHHNVSTAAGLLTRCEKYWKRSWQARRSQERQCPLPDVETVDECQLCLSLGRSLTLEDSRPPSVENQKTCPGLHYDPKYQT